MSMPPPTPVLRRLDHLICEVHDIDAAVAAFRALGYPLAWPIGRFWPHGRTAGIALGGVNLEFLQPDDDPPEAARIRTLVFEPVDLDRAVDHLTRLGETFAIEEKWEADPELLRLRGFDGVEAIRPQLICRNAYPTRRQGFDYFLCDYAPALKARLCPASFPGVAAARCIALGSPTRTEDSRCLDLWDQRDGVEIVILDEPVDAREVRVITTDLGPLELGALNARFRFE